MISVMITENLAPNEGGVLDSQIKREKVTECLNVKTTDANDDSTYETPTYLERGQEKLAKIQRKSSNLKFKPSADNTNDISNDEEFVNDSEKRHVSTYKIRFKHNGYVKSEEDLKQDLSEGETGDSNQQECNDEQLTEKNTKSQGSPEGTVYCPLQDSKLDSKQFQCPDFQKNENTQCTRQETFCKKEHLSGSNSWSTATSNLPLLPGMQGNVITKTSNGKTIRSLNGSKSSNWILVGKNGKRHLRQPTPLPTETFPPLTKTLPPIESKPKYREDSVIKYTLPPIGDSLLENDMISKVSKWGLKTNRVTLSALLEVDHKQACLRDQSLEFGKELLFKARLEPLKELCNTPKIESDESEERNDNDAKVAEWKQVEDLPEDHLSLVDDQESLEEHCPSTPVVILTPLPPAIKENIDIECLPTNKEKTERHYTTCKRECNDRLRKNKDQCNAVCQASKKPAELRNKPCQASKKPADHCNAVCQTNKKLKLKKQQSCLRKSRSTLPDDIPYVSNDEKLPALPDKLQYVFDDKMFKIPPDRKVAGVRRVVSNNANTIRDSFDLREESPRNAFADKSNGNNVSRSSNKVVNDKDDNCADFKSDERSDSTIREMLAVDMDFECQNDFSCAFEDDNTLQRAVVLRNQAFYPQATSPPPPSPHQVSRNCSCIFDHQNMPESHGESAQFDESLKPSDGDSLMDQLGPTLRELEHLIDQNFNCIRDKFIEEQTADYGRNAKLSKSVRFADLPPRRKRELARSKSDPTTESSKTTAQTSAEWNECFLVAVGENRAIKKEVRKQHQRKCRQQEIDYNDDTEDGLGPELIEREMKRYIHWLRHDRAIEQHRWLSSSVSHRNLPMSTHHVPSQQPPVSYGVNTQLSSSSISAKVAKAIGLYSVLPKPDLEGPPAKPVRFPKVPVLPPIAGGSNEVLFGKTFTGEVKGLPIGGLYAKNRCSTDHNKRRGARD